MAVYTDITDAELDTLLEGYELGRARSFKGIAEGVENSNFLLETDTGRFILTVYERRMKAAELPFFIDLMQHLAARGFPLSHANQGPRRQGAADPPRQARRPGELPHWRLGAEAKRRPVSGSRDRPREAASGG